MKKIFSYATMLLAGLCIFTSCEDDRGSNPTLTQPTTFVLNNPAVGEGVVDLNLSTGIDLTWSQPTEYTTGNAPVVATYTVRISSTGTFNKQYDEAAEDNTGADFFAFDETTTSCSESVPTADIAKALQMLNAYPEDKDFTAEPLYFQIKSAVRDASLAEHNVILSNIVKANVLPYYVELKDAPVVMWYLVGNMFGGKWGSDIGNTALPMFLKDGFEYDKKTGCGELEFTNFFTTGEFDNTGGNESSTSGFKIQRDDFNWDWGMTGDNGKYGVIIARNGGSDGGHIVAPEDGVYTITLNTANLTATMVKFEGSVKNYGTIQLSGSFNDWGNTAMLPYNKEGVENHAWYYVMENSSAIELKFKLAPTADSDGWGTNWGSSTFPTGLATQNGDNIPVPAGKWIISFNDITGAYSILAL